MKYSKEAFNKLIQKAQGSFYVKYTTDPISLTEIAKIGTEGLNDLVTDSTVEDGFYLEDIIISASGTKEGKVIIAVKANVNAWQKEHCCPNCGALKRVALIPDEVGKGISERTICSSHCGWKY